jgi:GntR family transcriptional regulator
MPKKAVKKKAANKKRGSKGGASAMPLYHQSYLTIRQRLLEGVYPLNEPIPSEEEIRHEFGVSRVTIRRALAELEAEGLIRRKRGSGTYPAEQKADVSIRSNISGLYENLITLGLNTKAQVVTYELIEAPRFLSRIDERFTGEVLHIDRIRQLKGEPFSFLESYIPGDLADKIDQSDLTNKPLIMLLEMNGIEAVTAEQALSAVVADADVAAALKVPVGSPLIQMKRLSRDKDHRAIEFFKSYYRPDRFEYRMTLSRVQGSEAPHWTPVS